MLSDPTIDETLLKVDNPTAFKHWFNQNTIQELADQLLQHHPKFDRPGFLRALKDLETLELKARVKAITEALHPALNLDFPQAAQVIMATLGPPAQLGVPNQFQLQVWPLVHYVGCYGLGHFEAAMAALHACTQRFSAEFDIRPFLIRHPQKSLAQLQEWTQDPSAHVRRLVSEGSRSRLPWGERLTPFIEDPSPVFPLLEALKDDSSPYVRKSVGNNLNDIAKDHPERVVECCRRWLAERPTPERKKIVHLALRSLIKQGHAGALKVLGHGDASGLSLYNLQAPAHVNIGTEILFSFDLKNQQSETVSLAVDYRVFYVGARGSHNAKVFKLKTLKLAAGEQVQVSKKHKLKPVSIRPLYPGIHRIEIQVNGAVLGGFDFDLVAA